MYTIFDISKYIYLVYPTPTFCLQKWVEPVGWCRKSGAGPAAACCAEAAHHGIGLPCLQRNLFSDRNAALIVGLGKALVNVPRFHSNHRHIGLSASSGGSTQVQLSGPHERDSACNAVPS